MIFSFLLIFEIITQEKKRSISLVLSFLVSQFRSKKSWNKKFLLRFCRVGQLLGKIHEYNENDN